MEVCKCSQLSAEEIDKIRYEMPAQLEIDGLAEFFKVFGDPGRLKIIYYLSKTELCVADLARLVQMAQPAVSQQLKILRLTRFVNFRKEGKTVYYSLHDEHVSELYQIALHHIREL
ncbi:MAG: transcriptional regulator [Candidatus Cloacimonetes bacterium HGW-Cloacimonetes-1]|nr:MAG: transcriptional regulator [Candidatus Cloacimonetes bacterium HGW-Cloacimonetes-1]